MLNEKTIKKLEELSELEEGWNGYDAPPISDRVIDNTRTVLSYLSFEPQIFPTGRNSIQLEYGDDENRIELEIFDNEAQYGVIKNYEYISFDEPITLEDCVAVLNDFYTKNKK